MGTAIGFVEKYKKLHGKWKERKIEIKKLDILKIKVLFSNFQRRTVRSDRRHSGHNLPVLQSEHSARRDGTIDYLSGKVIFILLL